MRGRWYWEADEARLISARGTWACLVGISSYRLGSLCPTASLDITRSGCTGSWLIHACQAQWVTCKPQCNDLLLEEQQALLSHLVKLEHHFLEPRKFKPGGCLHLFLHSPHKIVSFLIHILHFHISGDGCCWIRLVGKCL